MKVHVTNDQVEELARSAVPYSLVILRWGPRRGTSDVAPVEAEHQRRMVQLRADGVIAILCPVASDSVCGVVVMNVTTTEAGTIMREDPCVRGQVMTYDVYQCHGFPGDRLPPSALGGS